MIIYSKTRRTRNAVVVVALLTLTLGLYTLFSLHSNSDQSSVSATHTDKGSSGANSQGAMNNSSVPLDKPSVTISNSPALSPVQPPPIRAIDDAAIRAALSSENLSEVENAFDVLAKCASIRQTKQLLQGIDKSSPAAAHAAALNEQLRSDELLCKSISSNLVLDRMNLLKSSLDRKFSPGLANRFYDAGPLGNWDEIQLRPDDPIVISWYDDAKEFLTKASKQGDANAMRSLVHIYRNGPPSIRSSVGALTFQIVETELQRRAGTALANGMSEKHLKAEESKLSPNELRRAKEEASKILQSCCSQR